MNLWGAWNLGTVATAYARHGYHSRGNGLLSLVLHAAIWSSVSRIIRTVPLGLVVALVAVVLVVGVAQLLHGRKERDRVPYRHW